MSRFLIFALVLLGLTAHAHHSRSHYSNDVVEVEGDLVAVHWVNPHVGFTVDIATEKGEVERWRIEGLSNLGGMRRAGIPAERFTLGERVQFLGSLSVRRPRDFLASNMLLEDGTEILLGAGTEPYWANRAVGRQSQAMDDGPVVDAAAENLGIYRVWSGVPRGQRTHFPFTQAAIAARADWDPIDNFAERCEPEGMPRIMRNPHPFEFEDHGSEIHLISELYDLTRIIYMDRTEAPAGIVPTPLGYSVGRWDGDTLVATTTHVSWRYFDNIGTPQTPDVEFVERFELSDDQARLDYTLTVTDPATFTAPAVYERYWLALGAEIERYDCTVF